MSKLAANPAASPHLSLCIVCASWIGQTSAFPHATTVANRALPVESLAARNELRFRRTSMAGMLIGTLVQSMSAVMYPALCSVTASGPIRRPAAARSSASTASPCGLRFPYRTLRKCRASALGSRAHSLGFAMCDPSRIREINETETPPCIRTK